MSCVKSGLGSSAAVGAGSVVGASVVVCVGLLSIPRAVARDVRLSPMSKSGATASAGASSAAVGAKLSGIEGEGAVGV